MKDFILDVIVYGVLLGMALLLVKTIHTAIFGG